MRGKQREQSGGNDLKATGRRRNVAIQVGLTAVVVIAAVALVIYIVMSDDQQPAGSAAKSVRVASSNLITQAGSTEPKVVLSLYEDFLCPVCGRFEQQFGVAVNQLVNSGAIAADYYMVAILDRPQNQNYSSRAGGAAYCVADDDTTPDKQAFQRFHGALYGRQPSESGPAFPTNTELIETARQVGIIGDVAECVNSGKYADRSSMLAAATSVTVTPTVRINDEDYRYSTPEALIAKIREIVG
jgi:protein-disulfide isomerase